MGLERRVVVTGVGLISPVGIGTENTWKAITAGTSGIASITQFDATDYDCRIAGEVKGFDPTNWIERKDVKKLGRFAQFAVAASQ
ncbi:MAG TPA: beta-ketoacyl synthase N-terminal-like domain-containing protein, partial [Candidatus Solibacter sp.]